MDETASYWARAAFFHHAEALYDLHGSYPKRRDGARVQRAARHHADHEKRAMSMTIVGRVQERAQAIIKNELKLESKAIIGFAMTLSRGLPEHHRARRPGRLGGRAELSTGRSDSGAASS